MSKYLCHLTHEQLETHGSILSTVATDALVLKHQIISIHSADLDQLHWKFLHLHGVTLENKITFWKKKYPVVIGLSIEKWSKMLYLFASSKQCTP